MLNKKYFLIMGLCLISFGAFSDEAEIIVRKICQTEGETSGLPDFQKGLDACYRAHMKTFSKDEIKTVLKDDLEFREKVIEIQKDAYSKIEKLGIAYAESSSGQIRLQRKSQYMETLKAELFGDEKSSLTPEEHQRILKELKEDLIKNPIKLN